ncbi:unnamed protein product [Cuscuta epithymum]|uniref:Uncharacterized protein n=1 Tax=Cuscuta epithymum TaxID=186058 RepID=A0AAV0DV89_9ASTE|nr:unnamed protein product [Cuscuta epithymum]
MKIRPWWQKEPAHISPSNPLQLTSGYFFNCEFAFFSQNLVHIVMANKNKERSSSCSRWSLSRMTALVTGGTRGIRLAVVEKLAEMSACVYSCSRNEEQLNQCLQDWASKGLKIGLLKASKSRFRL